MVIKGPNSLYTTVLNLNNYVNVLNEINGNDLSTDALSG